MQKEIEDSILYWISIHQGCTLNSILCHCMPPSYSGRTTWPKTKKEYIPYVEQLVKDGRITAFDIVQDTVTRVFYPGGTQIRKI